MFDSQVQESYSENHEAASAIWEQQDAESSLHYSWFHTFLLLGEDRSLLGAYKEFCAKSSKSLQKYELPGAWKRAADKWKWRERTIAYDAHQRVEAEQRKTQARIAKEQELEEREFKLREEILDRVEMMLSFPIVHVEKTDEDGNHVTITPVKWNFNTIPRLLAAYELLKSSAEETTITVKGKNLESGAVAFKTRKSAEEYADEELIAIAIAGGVRTNTAASDEDSDEE